MEAAGAARSTHNATASPPLLSGRLVTSGGAVLVVSRRRDLDHLEVCPGITADGPDVSEAVPKHRTMRPGTCEDMR